MTPDFASTAGGREFGSTHWTHLLALKEPGAPDYREHLAALIRRYWKPVYHYVRALRRTQPDEAKDLAQAFFTRLLERRYLEDLSPDMGSFRGYLKTALKHFVANAARAERARRPPEGVQLLRFDEAEAEWTRLAPDGGQMAPEQAFDREWGRGVLMSAVEELAHLLARDGKEVYFQLFQAYYLQDAPASYEGLAQRHSLGVENVRNYLRYARKVLRELLARRVREYVGPGEDVGNELKFLFSR